MIRQFTVVLMAAATGLALLDGTRTGWAISSMLLATASLVLWFEPRITSEEQAVSRL